MKKILYIVDNKFRDLWGLYNLKEKLKMKNIDLKICNKFNWNLAIKAFDPVIVITPNARRDSKAFQKIIKVCKKEKIFSIIYPSEGLEYTNDYLNYEFPSRTLRDVDKFFLWTKDHGKVHKKKGFSKKVVVTGNLRFNDNLNYINKRKIKRIGITTTTRYTTSAISEINIPRLIFSRQHSPRFVSFIKQELEFFDAISKIFNSFKNTHIKFILKPHPFENANIYKKAFPEIEIEKDSDIRVFLSKIDLLLNQESSTNIHALKYKVPVINIEKLVKMNKGYQAVYSAYLPSKIGLKIKSLKELKKLVFLKNKESIYKKNIKNGDLKLIAKIAPNHDSLNIMVKELIKIDTKKESKFNIYYFIKYVIKDILIIIFNSRSTLFHPLLFKDYLLLKKFKIKN